MLVGCAKQFEAYWSQCFANFNGFVVAKCESFRCLELEIWWWLCQWQTDKLITYTLACVCAQGYLSLYIIIADAGCLSACTYNLCQQESMQKKHMLNGKHALNWKG